MESLADRVVMTELDSNVAAVWKAILSDGATALIRRIRRFEISRSRLSAELCREPRTEIDVAFQTILRNRVQTRWNPRSWRKPHEKLARITLELVRGWYPETLPKRIAAINAAKRKIEFLHKDAFDVIPKFLRDKSAAFFVDPPYTAGGKSAGKRLYLHSSIDHHALFDLLRKRCWRRDAHVRRREEKFAISRPAHGFFIKPIPMKTTHHTRMYKLAITNRPFAAADRRRIAAAS